MKTKITAPEAASRVREDPQREAPSSGVRSVPRFGLSLFGVGVVLRRQMRGRVWKRDLAGILFLILAIIALTAGLQAVWTTSRHYHGVGPVFLMRCLPMGLIAATLLLLPMAAVLGASAVPTLAERDSTQAMLLTRLRPFDIGAGRLLAALWPQTAVWAVSCLVWTLAQAVSPFLPESLSLKAILTAHFVLLCGVYMMGSVAFLGALRCRPGRAWGRGIGVGIGLFALSVAALFLLDGVIQRRADPVALIETVLRANPVVAVVSPLHFDILRTNWVYAHTSAHDYPIHYPAAGETALLFFGIGSGALTLASLRLRRAYQ